MTLRNGVTGCLRIGPHCEKSICTVAGFAGADALTAAAGFAAEVLLFAVGLSWLAIWAHSFAQAFRFGLYWFLSAEVIKILFAAAFAARFRRMVKG